MSGAPGNRGAPPTARPIPLTRESIIIAALAMPVAKKDPLIPLKYAPEPGEPRPRIQHSPRKPQRVRTKGLTFDSVANNLPKPATRSRQIELTIYIWLSSSIRPGSPWVQGDAPRRCSRPIQVSVNALDELRLECLELVVAQKVSKGDHCREDIHLAASVIRLDLLDAELGAQGRIGDLDVTPVGEEALATGPPSSRTELPAGRGLVPGMGLGPPAAVEGDVVPAAIVREGVVPGHPPPLRNYSQWAYKTGESNAFHKWPTILQTFVLSKRY